MGCSASKTSDIKQKSSRSGIISISESAPDLREHPEMNTISLRNGNRTEVQGTEEQAPDRRNAYQTRFGNRYHEAQVPRETTAARLIRPTDNSRAQDSEDSSEEVDNPVQNNPRHGLRLAMLGQFLARENPVIEQLFMNLVADSQTHERLNIFDPNASDKASALKLPETGLMPFQIESIYPIEYKKGMIKSDDPSKHECNICLVPFEDGDMVKSLQCLHMYHQKCIDDWLGKKSICPNCKFNMRALDIDQLI